MPINIEQLRTITNRREQLQRELKEVQEQEKLTHQQNFYGVVTLHNKWFTKDKSVTTRWKIQTEQGSTRECKALTGVYCPEESPTYQACKHGFVDVLEISVTVENKDNQLVMGSWLNGGKYEFPPMAMKTVHPGPFNRDSIDYKSFGKDAYRMAMIEYTAKIVEYEWFMEVELPKVNDYLKSVVMTEMLPTMLSFEQIKKLSPTKYCNYYTLPLG